MNTSIAINHSDSSTEWGKQKANRSHSSYGPSSPSTSTTSDAKKSVCSSFSSKCHPGGAASEKKPSAKLSKDQLRTELLRFQKKMSTDCCGSTTAKTSAGTRGPEYNDIDILLKDEPVKSPQRAEKSATGLLLDEKTLCAIDSDNTLTASFAECSLSKQAPERSSKRKKKRCSFSKKKRQELKTLQTFLASGNVESPDFFDKDDTSFISTQTEDSISLRKAKFKRSTIKTGA